VNARSSWLTRRSSTGSPPSSNSTGVPVPTRIKCILRSSVAVASPECFRSRSDQLTRRSRSDNNLPASTARRGQDRGTRPLPANIKASRPLRREDLQASPVAPLVAVGVARQEPMSSAAETPTPRRMAVTFGGADPPRCPAESRIAAWRLGSPGAGSDSVSPHPHPSCP
jgi:hypothetical protein